MQSIQISYQMWTLHNTFDSQSPDRRFPLQLHGFYRWTHTATAALMRKWNCGFVSSSVVGIHWRANHFTQATDIEILSLHKIYMHHILHSRDTSGDLTSSFRTNFLDLRVDRRQDSGRRGVNRLSQPVVYYVRAFWNICRWFHILNREPFL